MLDRKFPLELPDDTSGHKRIRWSLSGRRPDYGEMMGDHGEGGGHRGSIRRFPEGSIGRGRNLYRDGQVEEAVDCLKKATSSHPGDGEGWHLLGAALLELEDNAAAKRAFERALDVEQAYHPARYFLALELVRNGRSRKAVRELERLIGKVPKHWEAKLLLARLTGSLEKALALEREDPADPRVQEIIIHAAKGRDTGSEERAKRALESLCREPGAARRLEEFRSATRGRYMPPARVTMRGHM
jgi:tetratricopeptide (TPR) repeat protein